MRVKPWIDGIEVSVENRQKAMVFSVGNPILVCILVKHLINKGDMGILQP